MIRIHVLFSMSSSNIWIINKKEYIGFYNINPKTRSKPFLLFICSYFNQFRTTHFTAKLLNRKLSKIHFGKIQGIMFYKFLTILFIVKS